MPAALETRTKGALPLTHVFVALASARAMTPPAIENGSLAFRSGRSPMTTTRVLRAVHMHSDPRPMSCELPRARDKHM